MGAQCSVAVIHPNFADKGGAESVGMCVIESLQDTFDVTLFTMTEPDWVSLNDYFGSHVRPDRINVRVQHPRHRPITTVVASIGVRTAGFGFPLLQIAAFYRSVRSHCDEFDLVVSTYNELGECGNSVQYIHHPLFDRSVLPGRGGSGSPVYAAYDRLCQIVAGVDFDAATTSETRLLVNSQWMADVVEQAYGRRPQTLYPPIDTSDIDAVSWDERENGFVTLGRLSTDKNVPRNIRIIDGLRERGHDVHLHIGGPPNDADEVSQIRSMADQRPYVELEGELSRRELTTLLSTHRYGLHGKEYEHFGMVLAEMSLAGMLPFAHDSGGQREVIGGSPSLLYDDVSDAVGTISTVLSAPETQRQLRDSLPDVEETFGCERFKREFCRVVKRALTE